jgi:hypothetical protein
MAFVVERKPENPPMPATAILYPSNQIPAEPVCVDEVMARGGLGSGRT